MPMMMKMMMAQGRECNALCGVVYCTAALVLAAVMMLDVALATDYIVGGDIGWTIPPNKTFYDEWSAAIKFKTGDNLLFDYSSLAHNVQEVKKEDYANCNSSGLAIPIAFFNSGSDVINLSKSQVYYFYCGQAGGFSGHCYTGMRLQVVVGDVAVPPLPPFLPPPPPPLVTYPAYVSPPTISPAPTAGGDIPPVSSPQGTSPGPSPPPNTSEGRILQLAVTRGTFLLACAVAALFM